MDRKPSNPIASIEEISLMEQGIKCTTQQQFKLQPKGYL